MIGNVKEALVPFVKQKVKEWKKKKAEEKKKKEEEKKNVDSGSSSKQDKPTELETAKTKQPEIEAAMPVYEVHTIFSLVCRQRFFQLMIIFYFLGHI